MIDLYNIAKLFLGCKLGEDCTMAWHNKLGEYGGRKGKPVSFGYGVHGSGAELAGGTSGTGFRVS